MIRLWWLDIDQGKIGLISYQSKTTLTDLGKRLYSKLYTLSKVLGIQDVLDGPGPIATPQQSAAPFKQPKTPTPFPPDFDAATSQEIIRAALSQTPALGELVIPQNQTALATLLSPTSKLDDLTALDLLYSLFPASTKHSNSRVLLAIARAATARFGREGRLPLTAMRTWGMLNIETFTDEVAAQFTAISAFILGWHAENDDFLHLDSSEIALLEFMFENLHPRKQGLLAAKVMDFRVLGNRRMGLIRRMPNRIEQLFREAHEDPQVTVQYSKDCLALLDHLARPGGFAPIIEEAKLAAAKIIKTLQRITAPPPAPNPPVAEPPILPPPVITTQAPPQPSANTLTVTPPKRLTKRHRTEASLRFLRGESAENIGKSLGVNASAVEGWAEAFISGGSSVLSYREKDGTQGETNEVNSLKLQIDNLTKMVEAMNQTQKERAD